MSGLQSPELARLFDVCQRIELAHASVYRALADAHHYHPTIAALWRKTANEEDCHAAQFRLASSSYVGAITSVDIDLTQATQILDSVEATFVRIRTTPPGILDALRTAVRMEETMAAMHMDQVAKFKNPSHQRLFRAMMRADEGHIDALREALRAQEADAAQVTS